MAMDAKHKTPPPDDAVRLPRLVSVEVLARRWTAKPDSLRAWERRGILPPAVRIGRKMYFREEDLLAFLERRRSSAPIGRTR